MEIFIFNFADLLSLTQLHTASLEDHAKHLTKRVDGLRSLISSAKASGAVKKLLPTAVTGQAQILLVAFYRK